LLRKWEDFGLGGGGIGFFSMMIQRVPRPSLPFRIRLGLGIGGILMIAWFGLNRNRAPLGEKRR
jgi:hypothetical protein